MLCAADRPQVRSGAWARHCMSAGHAVPTGAPVLTWWPGGRGRRVSALEKAEALKIQVVKAAEAESEAKFLQGQVQQPHSPPPPPRLSPAPPRPARRIWQPNSPGTLNAQA